MNKWIGLLVSLQIAVNCIGLSLLVADDLVDSRKLTKLSTNHLPNCLRVHPKVISGGLPDGDSAFHELVELGIKTVISVDGMQPNVELATKYGLRYVHLPHGYDGISARRVSELAKAVRELQGPIYIHCHHGKHRSPAAASVACVSAGLIPESEAVAVLHLAGTSPNYRGLFKAASEARPLNARMLDELEVDYTEVAEVPPLAEAMVAIEHAHDHLMQVKTAGWKTPPDHPDLDPQHVALLLREHFAEMLRSKESQSRDEQYKDYLRDSQAAAQRIETTLQRWDAESGSRPPKAIFEDAQSISDNCIACHVRYRDNRD